MPETAAGLARKLQKNKNICTYLRYPLDGWGLSIVLIILTVAERVLCKSDIGFPMMVLMETEQITAQEWHDRYLQPFYNLASDPNAEPTSEMIDGYAGFVLDGILAVKNIDGQEANDWECVELVEELIRYAMIMDGRVDK